MRRITPLKLKNNRGKHIGLVDPDTGQIFTIAGNESYPVYSYLGFPHLSKRHAACRDAAEALGIELDPVVMSWEVSVSEGLMRMPDFISARDEMLAVLNS